MYESYFSRNVARTPESAALWWFEKWKTCNVIVWEMGRREHGVRENSFCSDESWEESIYSLI